MVSQSYDICISEISTKDNCAKPKTPEKPKTLPFRYVVSTPSLFRKTTEGRNAELDGPGWFELPGKFQPNQVELEIFFFEHALKIHDLFGAVFCCFKMMKILLVSVKANRNILLI